MAKKDGMSSIGAWAFLGGLVLSVLAGIFVRAGTGGASTVAMVLGVLGLIVGLLNITAGEVMMFLLAGVAFMVSASSLALLGVQLLGSAGSIIGAIFSNVGIFVSPAVAVVAIKAVYDISKS